MQMNAIQPGTIRLASMMDCSRSGKFAARFQGQPKTMDYCSKSKAYEPDGYAADNRLNIQA